MSESEKKDEDGTAGLLALASRAVQRRKEAAGQETKIWTDLFDSLGADLRSFHDGIVRLNAQLVLPAEASKAQSEALATHTKDLAATTSTLSDRLKRLERVERTQTEAYERLLTSWRRVLLGMAVSLGLGVLLGGVGVAYLSAPNDRPDLAQASLAALVTYDGYVTGELYPRLKPERQAEIRRLRARLLLPPLEPR